MDTKTLTVALIGAGNRGQGYTNIMSESNRFKVIAVAEPVKEERDYIKNKHGIKDEMCFDSWEQLLARPKFADVVIIATTDRMHYAPAMKAIELGYNLLLEKPAAPTAEECVAIANAAKRKGVKVLVCHVLRYTPFFGKIKQMIDEGKLGKVLSIHHMECVGNIHQSHSFVRGNWGNAEKSAPMILAKSCHDVDMIQWLIGSPCTSVQSYGALSYFKRENAPEGAPERCIDGCPYAETCHYNSVKLYLEDEKNLWFREAATKDKNPSNERVERALRETQYGKCVFKCDNDVVDHQVVNMEFANSAVASFNMCAFTYNGRFIRVMGTEGELTGDGDRNLIEYFSFKTREHETISTSDKLMTGSITDGHGGGDRGIVNTLYEYLTVGCKSDLLSEIGISTENHLIAFAAEKSRLEHRVINMDDYKKEIGLI